MGELASPILDSLKLAGAASVLTLLGALFICYANRLLPAWWMTAMVKISTLGYAVPGAILGVSIIAWSGAILQSGWDPGLVKMMFYHTTVGLIIAYSIRFLAVAVGPVEAGLRHIRASLDEASQTMNHSPLSTFLRVHLPLLRPAMLAGLLILFVDILKELPLTLILSPFNTETLALRTYSLFAVQEDYARGSLPALILVFTGIAGMTTVHCLLRSQKPTS